MRRIVIKNKELIIIIKEKGFVADCKRSDHKDFFFDEMLYKNLNQDPIKTLFYFGFQKKKNGISVSLLFLYKISKKFIENLARNPEIETEKKPLDLSEEQRLEILEETPFMVGSDYVSNSWLISLWEALSDFFKKETDQIQKSNRSIHDFLKEQDETITVMGRVYFHLVENKSDEVPFAFLATYSTAGINDKKATHMPLKNALLEYKDHRDQLLNLLSTVSKAVDKSDFISELVENGELFSPLGFNTKDAYCFLKEIPLYESSGIICRIPNWWKKKSIKLSLLIGEKSPPFLGMQALLNFNPELYFDGEKITKEEIETLLNQSEGLSLLKGKWVEVDHAKLKSVLAAYKNAEQLAKEESLSLADAMSLELNLTTLLKTKDDFFQTEVSNGDWLHQLKSRLLNPNEIQTVFPDETFKAELRHYQQEGFNWLLFMKELGFGALLADDMGLGKTVQILALLDKMRSNKNLARTLLIIPASLIGNWEKEIEKFAPKLKVKLIHGTKETLNPKALDEETLLYITTYGMVIRRSELMDISWELVILDEAQAIKNPRTKQTKAIKQIEAKTRIAMTGTPIENRLADLWSIFDFLNAGLLGTAKEFTGLCKELEAHEDYSKLRSVVSPFILRRLKTDKKVIDDLPEKIEVKEYISLTKKQTVLYKNLVKELENALKSAEGISRKGMVLAAIMKFKQICNHPDQYLGQKEFKPLYSAKFEKLREICETIYEKREQVLVFTQFKEMTDPISDYLETVFDRKGLVLHGATAIKKRTEMVEKFCDGKEYIPFMVLSLKAGGVGLNLIGANHVIHFDRWWNPAIENQATDRAFRIGQRKNVMVHKFVTSGSIEEKIDQMLEEKQGLASDIIGKTGEKWITEMNNDELLALFALER